MPSSDFTPTLAQVGAILRARTKDTGGNELGTFTADTRPTDAEAEEKIGLAVQDVVEVIGSDIPQAVFGPATYVAALGTALLIELSYFPEQIGTGRSPYAQLKELYDERLVRLKTAAEAAGDEDVPGATPKFSFPMTGDPYIIGRRTAW